MTGWLARHFEPLFPAADPSGVGVRLLYTALVLLALDLGNFIGHFLQHRVPLLWEFHKVHHSAQVLTPVTVYRMHPIDDIVAGACSALCIGAVVGAFAWGLGHPVWEVLVTGVNLGLFLFYLFGYNLRHSHVWVAYPKWLSWLLVSPAQHQIHHSTAPRHFNKNLGSSFLLGSCGEYALRPQGRESLEFGIGNGEDEQFNGVAALYLLPFRNATNRLLALTRRQQQRR